MNRTPTTIAALVLALALSVFAVATIASCAGPRSKSVTLFPAAELAWPAVSEDFHRGVADGLEDGDLPQPAADELRSEAEALGRALDARDVDAVRAVPWPIMQPWVDRGIDDKLLDGEIGPGVAASLREQLAKFTSTIDDIQGIL